MTATRSTAHRIIAGVLTGMSEKGIICISTKIRKIPDKWVFLAFIRAFLLLFLDINKNVMSLNKDVSRAVFELICLLKLKNACSDGPWAGILESILKRAIFER